jgi:pimeloyl-ACP methyl ester carboxylesterase
VPLLNNYNILIYDLLGHGDTTKKPDQITLHSFSEQLHSLILNLKIDNSVLIGFSLGSMIARQYSSEHSETVKALILLNSPHRVTENEKN